MRLIDADAMMKRLKAWDTNDAIDKALYNFALNRVLEAPTVEPDTTTHDSIPAENGRNDGDRTSGDCISRMQAIDALLGITAMRNTIPLDSAIFNIKKLPSVQPERPKGEWIHQSKFSRIECDQCGKVFRNSFAPKNFCPNCGADMKGEQE